jgi:hypothetical protein
MMRRLKQFKDGDLQGYVSNVVYKGTYCTPEEAWDITARDTAAAACLISSINTN